jgi:hypothetical protein
LRRTQCRRAGTAAAGGCDRSSCNAGEGTARPVQGVAAGVPTEPREAAWRVGRSKKPMAEKLSAGCPWRGGGGSVPVALRAAASLSSHISVRALGRGSRPTHTSARGQGMATEGQHGGAEYGADAIGRAARVGAASLCAWGAWREGSWHRWQFARVVPLSYGPPWAHYLGGYHDRLLGGPLGLPGKRYTAPEGVEHKDYTGIVLG